MASTRKLALSNAREAEQHAGHCVFAVSKLRKVSVTDDHEAKQMQATYEAEGFWSDTYRGRPIAILNHGGRWLVYLDHVLQLRMQFDSAEAAVSWLQHKVDRPRARSRLH